VNEPTHTNTGDANGRTRDGQGQFLRSLENAERDARAVALRTRGASYQQIADELKYADRATAYRAVKAMLLAIPAKQVAELRAVEGERLDRLTAEAFAVLERDHLHVSQGGKIVRDDDGQLVLDDGPKLAAINTLVRIAERRARLFGLDAPVKVNATLSAADELDAREVELLATIDRLKEGRRRELEAAAG